MSEQREPRVGDIITWQIGAGGIGVVAAYEPTHQTYSDLKLVWVRPALHSGVIALQTNHFEIVGHVDE